MHTHTHRLTHAEHIIHWQDKHSDSLSHNMDTLKHTHPAFLWGQPSEIKTSRLAKRRAGGGLLGASAPSFICCLVVYALWWCGSRCCGKMLFCIYSVSLYCMYCECSLLFKCVWLNLGILLYCRIYSHCVVYGFLALWLRLCMDWQHSHPSCYLIQVWPCVG